MVVSVLSGGVHQSAGEREVGCARGLVPGTLMGRAWAGFGWLGCDGPFPFFFEPFSFSIPGTLIKFAKHIQMGSNKNR